MDPDEYDDFDDEDADAAMNCQMTDDGTCQLAGTWDCEMCPYNPANE